MYQLKKIDLGSVAIYSFLMFLILGFILLLPFGIVGVFMSNMAQESGFTGPDPFAIFSGIFLIFIPLIYAVFGTIINLIIAFIYNMLSIKFGGIKLSIRKFGIMENITELTENN